MVVRWSSRGCPLGVLFVLRAHAISALARLYQWGFWHDLQEEVFINTVGLAIRPYLVVLLPVENVGHQILVEHFDKSLRLQKLKIIL